jgi:Calcium-activated SK potassium channel/Ion channel
MLKTTRVQLADRFSAVHVTSDSSNTGIDTALTTQQNSDDIMSLSSHHSTYSAAQGGSTELKQRNSDTSDNHRGVNSRPSSQRSTHSDRSTVRTQLHHTLSSVSRSSYGTKRTSSMRSLGRRGSRLEMMLANSTATSTGVIQPKRLPSHAVHHSGSSNSVAESMRSMRSARSTRSIRSALSATEADKPQGRTYIGPDGIVHDEAWIQAFEEEMGGLAHNMVTSFTTVLRDMRFNIDAAFVAAMVGVLFQVIQREVDYSSGSAGDVTVQILRSITTISTCVLLYYLYQYFQSDWEYEKLDRAYLHNATTWTTPRLVQFSIEFLVCLIHEPPGLSVTSDISVAHGRAASVNNLFGLLIFLRFYLVFRVVLNHYYTGGTKILGIWHNFNFTMAFVVRNVLYSQPFSVLLPLLTILGTVFAYAMFVCERELAYDPSKVPMDFGSSVWLVYITMAAVGYGDIVPQTSCGRGVAILSSMLAIILTAVLVATIYQSLTLLPYESRMVEFLQRVHSVRSLKDLAARSIQTAYRFHLAKKRKKWKLTILKAQHDMIDAVSNFQKYRKVHSSFAFNLQNNQLFRSMLETIEERVKLVSNRICPDDSDDDESDNGEEVVRLPEDIQKMDEILDVLSRVREQLDGQTGMGGGMPGPGVGFARHTIEATLPEGNEEDSYQDDDEQPQHAEEETTRRVNFPQMSPTTEQESRESSEDFRRAASRAASRRRLVPLAGGSLLPTSVHEALHIKPKKPRKQSAATQSSDDEDANNASSGDAANGSSTTASANILDDSKHNAASPISAARAPDTGSTSIRPGSAEPNNHPRRPSLNVQLSRTMLETATMNVHMESTVAQLDHRLITLTDQLTQLLELVQHDPVGPHHTNHS